MHTNKKAKNIYEFLKYTNGKKHGYYMLNYKDKPEYKAYAKTKFFNFTEYSFENNNSRQKYVHSVGEVSKDIHNGTTFLFDGIDIWKYFAMNGISYRSTIVNDELTVFRVFRHEEEIASARETTGRSGMKSFVIEDSSNALDIVFLVFFAIARTTW
ncbi:MAG: hypothetical protein E7520_00565 [Ruminococcaceae bacterium]|nr:hypothetical protein [Oscillospiraceae bacterium]